MRENPRLKDVMASRDSASYDFSQMRFRAKFDLLSWAYVALALFVLALTLSPGHHNEVMRFFVVSWTILAALKILSQIFIYWDVNSACLREQRPWNEKKIPWEEVTRVSAWNPKQPSSDVLAIDYVRPAPMSDRGSIIVNPEDRQQFLANLRRSAPQATFDV